jgi:hypothetical protein
MEPDISLANKTGQLDKLPTQALTQLSTQSENFRWTRPPEVVSAGFLRNPVT